MPASAPAPTARLIAGDPLMREGPPANVPIERDSIDARRHFRGATWGQLVWSGRVEVSGTSAAPVVKIGAIDAVTLCEGGNGTSSGTWRPYSWNLNGLASDVGASAIEGGGALLGDRHYHLYAVNDGTTTLAFQLSLTPPSASLAAGVQQQWKRGQNANYRYLATFRTNASGDPIKGFLANGRFTYRSTASAGYDYALGSGSTAGRATAWTGVDLSSLVPEHARLVRLHCTLQRDGGAGAIGLQIRAPGDAGHVEVCCAPNVAGVATYAAGMVEIVTPAPSIDYQLTAAVAASDPNGATIRVLGWE